jgi:hypothetical protein
MANKQSGCDSQFGGRITLNIAGQQYSPSEADVTIKPTNRENEAEMNQDGTMSTRQKLVPAEIDVKFRNNSGINWQANMLACAVNATVQEEDNNRQWLMTGGRFTGRPEINLSTGEVSGIILKGPLLMPVG